MSKQISLFPAGTGTPLFSGTAQHGRMSVYRPAVTPRQQKMADCPICLDTGEVMIKGQVKKCMCPAGLRDRKDDNNGTATK